MDLPVKTVADGVTLVVRVTPRARKNEIVGVEGEALRVRLHAPPVEGAANVALCALLAEALGVRSSAVTLLTGQTGRVKVVHVRGVTADQVQALARDIAESADA